MKTIFISVRYVLKENLSNLYRIYSIAKYDLLSEMRESNLGLFWNFAHPLIQVLTYWFAFAYVFHRKEVTQFGITLPYIFWQISGMVCWFFISPCITNGCNAIYSKINIITKMKFPVSVLPATVVLKELFNHFCLLLVVVIIFAIGGHYPSWHWLGLIYYCAAACIFTIALSMTTSVLNMLARDVRKLVLALMRLLLYMTPVLWNIEMLEQSAPKPVLYIMKANPVFYIIQGYRDCFWYHQGFMHYWKPALVFWGITLFLFVFGSCMMYKFKRKVMDLM